MTKGERNMGAAEHLGVYAQGWTNGEADTILKATSENYTFNDPNSGVIPKKEFAGYLAELKETVKSLRGGRLPNPFMELSEVVTQENQGVITAWCWWAIPGTDIKGSGLIKVGADGVRSEVITYYSKLPG
jgi:hypothetical protein